MTAKAKKSLAFAAAILILLMFGRGSIERRLLFYPSHQGSGDGLTPWLKDGAVIGYAHEIKTPKNVWLLIHGNAGEASDRTYALDSFSPNDSVFVLEYPGFGKRSGSPTFEAIKSAARDAYLHLRATYPKTPVCVAGESIGTGPTSFLATVDPPPDKIVLIVPFNDLAAVARDHFPGFLVSLLLSHRWNNAAALANYQGPIDIFAAKSDTIIRPDHARALAAALKSPKLILFDGGHNDWSHFAEVKIRNP